MKALPRDVEIVTRYRGGQTTTMIADRFGIAPSTAWKIVRRSGTPLRPPGFRAYNSARDRAIVARHQRGEALAAIGRDLGISRQRVHVIVRRAP